jgi:hypothetical protein
MDVRDMTNEEKKALLEYKLKNGRTYNQLYDSIVFPVYKLYDYRKTYSPDYLLEVIKIEEEANDLFDASTITNSILRNQKINGKILNYIDENVIISDCGEILGRYCLDQTRYENVKNLDLILDYQDSVSFSYAKKSVLLKLLLNNYNELKLSNIKLIIKEILNLR